MDHQWFWQTEGELYGPLSTDELEDLVRRNRIKQADQIRLDGSADWLPAAQVKAMFAAPVDPSSETGAQSAARVLAGINRRQLEGEADQIPWGARFAGLVGKGVRGPAGFLGACGNLAAGGMRQAAKVIGLKVTLAVVVVLCLAILLKSIGFGDTQTDETRENLASAWEDFQAMKKSGASPAEWEEFERQTLAWLDPAMKELGESAVQNQSASRLWGSSRFDKALGQRNLVSAGWILRDLVGNAREPQPEAPSAANVLKDINGKPIPPLGVTLARDSQEALFSKRINMAEAYLTGDFRTSLAGAGTPVATSPVDPMMAGIIVVDAGSRIGSDRFLVDAPAAKVDALKKGDRRLVTLSFLGDLYVTLAASYSDETPYCIAELDHDNFENPTPNVSRVHDHRASGGDRYRRIAGGTASSSGAAGARSGPPSAMPQ